MQTSANHEKDLLLARAALRGDRAARAELGERLVAISRFLHARNRRLGSPLGQDELLDLVQDVQLAVWRKLDTFEGRAALETWVFRFCHIGMLKFLERRSRHAQRTQLLTNEDLSEEAIAGGEVGADEGFTKLLGHLSRREAEVARLRYLEQLELDEIAQLLDISVSSVKTHAYRALGKLRTIVAPRAEEGSR